MWMDKGVIVSIVDWDGDREEVLVDCFVLIDKLIVVLVDGDLVSVSEILVGVFKDNGCVIIIGD